MPIGLNVKLIRKQKKISPDTIAKHLGKGGRQWVYDLEKGKIKRLSEEDRIKLAEILGVSVIELTKKNNTENVQEPLQLYSPTFEFNLNKLNTKNEKYAFLLQENLRLWRENSLLKSIIIKNNIDIYNTDTQNETV